MFKHHTSHIALSVPDAMMSRVLMFSLQGHTEQTPPKTYTCQHVIHITPTNALFSNFQGNTELQIAGGGNTVSDEKEAIATPVRHCTEYLLEVVHSLDISSHYSFQ